MSRAIREHLRDFLAIVGLIAAGLIVTLIILGNQASALPSWVPFLGEDRFELKAEFTSAQAVTCLAVTSTSCRPPVGTS